MKDVYVDPYIAGIIAAAQQHGISSKLLAEKAEISVSQLESGRALNDQEYDRLVEASVELTQHPSITLDIGAQVHVGGLGVLGHALVSCSSVRDSLNLFLRFHRILLPRANLILEENEDRTALRYSYVGQPTIYDQRRMEIFFSGFSVITAFLLPQSRQGTVMYFSQRQPKHIEHFRQLFECELQFDSAFDGCAFDSYWLNQALETANPELNQVLNDRCDDLLAPLLDEYPLSNRIRRLLIETHTQHPSMEQVAAHFNISERTLRRRLTEEKTSFRKLWDQIRMELSSHYLSDPRLPATDVGRMLGFDDPTNFRRAFKRWFKTTPSAFRNQKAN